MRSGQVTFWLPRLTFELRLIVDFWNTARESSFSRRVCALNQGPTTLPERRDVPQTNEGWEECLIALPNKWWTDRERVMHMFAGELLISASSRP